MVFIAVYGGVYFIGFQLGIDIYSRVILAGVNRNSYLLHIFFHFECTYSHYQLMVRTDL